MQNGCVEFFAPESRVLDSYRLQAAQLSSDVWIVSRGLRSNALDPELSSGWLNASQLLVERTLQLIDASSREGYGTAVVSLPDWEAPLTKADREMLRCLKGGHLVLIGDDVEGRLGFREFRKFSELGIRSVVFKTHFRDDVIAEIVFNSQSRSQHLRSTLALFLHRRLLVSNRRLARMLRPVTFRVSEDGCCATPKVPTLDVPGETDHFEKFMVYEGMRQMPPVRNVHADIGRKRDGRYSVWAGELYFAPTEAARLFRKPYWVVDNDPRHHKLLNYYPRRHIDPGISQTRLDVAFACDRELAEHKMQVGDLVIVATHALPPGGAERQWVYLALGLKRAGYDVRFVVYRKLFGVEAHYSYLLDEAGIPVINLDGLRPRPLSALAVEEPLLWALCRAKMIEDVPYFCRITDLLNQLRPRAVFVQLDEPNIYVSLAALVAKVPHIVPSFRNANPTHFAYHRAWYQRTYRFIARSTRVKLTGNSRRSNDDYAEWLGLEPDRIACIPNALDETLFPKATESAAAQTRCDLKLAENTKVILGVFRLSDEKNPSCFLRTVERVAREIPDLRALLVGMGPLAEPIAKEAESRGLSDIVAMLGRREDVNTLMSIADVLLLTSNHEGLPNVVLEAQLMGLPVVATDVGGTSAALEPGRSGYICPPADVEALGAACIAILKDRGLAERMAKAGADFVRERFGLMTMTERYIALVDGSGAREDGADRAADVQDAERLLS